MRKQFTRLSGSKDATISCRLQQSVTARESLRMHEDFIDAATRLD